MSDATYTPAIKEIGDKIVALSLLQAKELSDYLKNEYGLEAAAAAAVVQQEHVVVAQDLDDLYIDPCHRDPKLTPAPEKVVPGTPYRPGPPGQIERSV